MNYKSWVLLLFSFVPEFLVAQGPASNWYFGNNAGLYFFGSKWPASLRDGKMKQREGCATISDNQGNLKFYTNGVTVWNRNHEVMPNGVNLNGHQSSSQSAIIIPKPGSTTIFYVFTTDAGAYENPPNNGVHYSIVDMTKEKSMGDVVKKNVLLISTATEKLSAVYASNGTDVWVVSHGWQNNFFYAWLVTPEGVADKPVVSRTGSLYEGGYSTEGNSIGCLRISPDGKKIASAIYEEKFFELYDFNDSTGVVSNPQSIQLPFGRTLAYGVEFSPNSRLVYISIYQPSEIYQFDIFAGTQFQIADSYIKIADPIAKNVSTLQLAPDGRIYCALKSKWIGCITNPNAIGMDCKYNDQFAYLDVGKMNLGLPNFIVSYFKK